MNASHLLIILSAVGAALALGSVVRLAQWALRPGEKTRDRLASLVVWLAMFGLLTAATYFGPPLLLLIFWLASLVGVWEFSRLLARGGSASTFDVGLCAVLITAHYALLATQVEPFLSTLLPVAAVVILPLQRVWKGDVKSFSRDQAPWAIGLLTVGYCLSHAPWLLFLTDAVHAKARPAGAFWFLILLTETSDICQALIGKRFGRRKITPIVSPHKTWEGFLGGGCCTLLLSVLLAPWLLSVGPGEPWAPSSILASAPVALLLGAAIFVSGFAGDITMSAWKRESGVKDSGQWLPGQGGILDRVDSLTFAAPTCYYTLALLLRLGLLGGVES